MSEGTPGRAPDADTRTDEGKGATNGRPVPQPVRYGPRNGSPRGGASGANGANGSANGRGSNGRTVPGPSSSQQYRAPQTPRGPQGGSTGSDASGGASTGPEAKSANGRGAGPASYTHPRPNPVPTRPAPDAGDRKVTEARTAAAARNASVAKVRDGAGRDGSATPAARTSEETTVTAPVDETAVIPAATEKTAATSTSEPAADTAADTASATDASSTESGTGTGTGFFGRLRDRLVGPTPENNAAETGDAVANSSAPVTPDSETESRTEPDTAATDAEVTAERPLTWRDRLGIAPKAPKPQPVEVPASGPGVPTAVAAAAVAAAAAAGTAAPETKAAPSGPTTAPQPTEPVGWVTPASPVPAVVTDTVEIPAVVAGSVGPASPAAAATGQVLVAAKPRVGAARRTRKARLRLSRVDPWSVMKTALLFSIAAGIILVVATYGVWSVLNASGLFDAVNDMVKSVVSTPGDTTPFRIEEYVNTQKVIGVAAIIAVVDVLIFTALATLGSFLYNLAATVLGGLEVTLAED